MNKLTVVLLGIIIFIAAFLRIYKLDEIPPALNWDEAAAGYNAYTLANWGKDEWGNKFPLVFTSFRDDKHPVHIYITAVFVKFFGLSEFVTRLPSALLGVVTVAAMFFLTRKLFKSDLAGVFAAFILALSSYHIHFSRGLWEANFALAFYILGLALFFHIDQKKWLLPVAVFSLGLSFFSYHSAKVVVPPTILLLAVFYFRKITKTGKYLYIGFAIAGLFVFLTLLNPRILGFARAAQNKLVTAPGQGGVLELLGRRYLNYFSPTYLFIKGDQSSRGSVKSTGQFYKVEALLILVGVIALIRLRNREVLLIAAWLLLSPVAGALSGEEPSATRAIFMVGALEVVSAYGAASLISLFRNRWLKSAGVFIIVAALAWNFWGYINYYYKNYAKANAIEWQYGMREIVEFSDKHPEFYRVYVDKIRQQPYIFFLYYLKYPLPELLKTVKYDKTESQSYNTVASFDRYKFGGWDPIESYPSAGILYAVTPSYYSGLRYIQNFNVVKLIKYPDGGDAFYLVAGNE